MRDAVPARVVDHPFEDAVVRPGDQDPLIVRGDHRDAARLPAGRVPDLQPGVVPVRDPARRSHSPPRRHSYRGGCSRTSSI